MAVRRRTQSYSWKETVVLAVLLIVLVITVRWIYSTYQTKNEAQAILDQAVIKQQRLEQRLDRVLERNGTLDSEIGQRDFLVERQGMIGKGERVLILVEDRNQPVIVEEEKTTRSWWQQLWGTAE